MVQIKEWRQQNGVALIIKSKERPVRIYHKHKYPDECYCPLYIETLWKYKCVILKETDCKYGSTVGIYAWTQEVENFTENTEKVWDNYQKHEKLFSFQISLPLFTWTQVYHFF